MGTWVWAVVLVWGGVPASSPSPRVVVTEGLVHRTRILYISSTIPLHNYPPLELLERHTDIRFIYQRNPSPQARGEAETDHIGDGVLWDNRGYPAIRATRIEELREHLRAGQFDGLVFEENQLDEETQRLIVDYVENGGRLVWLVGGAEFAPGPLAALRPVIASARKPPRPFHRTRPLAVQVPDPAHPLVGGLPLEEMGLYTLWPVEAAPGTRILAESTFLILGLKPVGKGEVLAFNRGARGGLIQVVHTFGSADRVDTDFLWIRFWSRVLEGWCRGRPEHRAPVTVRPAAPTIRAGEVLPVAVEVHRPGVEPPTVHVTLEDSQARPMGRVDAGVVRVPAHAASGRYRLRARAVDDRSRLLGEGYAFVTVQGKVDVQVQTDKPGYRVAEPVRLTAAIKADESPGTALTVRLAVRDSLGVPVFYHAEPVTLQAGRSQELTVGWTMPDYGVEGWAFTADVLLEDVDGRRWAAGRHTFYRYQPWTMREKLLISNYWAGDHGMPASLMPLWAAYHRGVAYNAGHHWEAPYYARFNMRAWYQWGATRMELFTNDFRTPDFSHLDQRADAHAQANPSAAWVLHDFGEETGFYYHWSNNPFERTWKTDADIPAGAHALFRLYLRERYQTIDRLNEQWQTAFRSFDEVRLQRRHGLPAGWLFGPPPAEVPDNLAPVLDTHGFFFWYTRRVAERITGRLYEHQATADWTMSCALTFNLFSPVPMTQIHPALHARATPTWHAMARPRSRGGNTPFFSFHWGFANDERACAQLWAHNLALLATFWCNWGGQFNYDLTHSRSSFYLKKLMARVRPREKFFLDCHFADTTDVAIFHPALDWQTVHSRPNFILRRQGPEHKCMGQLGSKQPGIGWLGGPETQVYNALAASGYAPKFVTEDEIPRCRVLVLPATECISESAAVRIRAFVAAGGTLITLPWVATHNDYGRPYARQPGGGLDEVIGLRWEFPIIGQREVLVLASQLTDLAAPATATRPAAGLRLPVTQRLGSEPPLFFSYGHQRITWQAPDVQVFLKLIDGQPGLTVHPYGRGRAIHLNMFTFEPLEAQVVGHAFHQETFRQLLAGLVASAGVEAPLFIERPLLYGQGISEWVQYQYRLAGGPVRVLAVYADMLAPEIVGQVALREPIVEVHDILDSRQVPLRYRPAAQEVEETDPGAFTRAAKAGQPAALTFTVHLKPGEVKVYALVPYATGPIQLRAASAALVAGQSPLEVDVACLTADGQPVPGPHPVHLDVYAEDGRPLAMLSRKVSVAGRQRVRIPTRLGDPAGRWTLRATDALTGRRAEASVLVAAARQAGQVPAVDDWFYPTAQPRPIAVSDEEFVNLLEALAVLYKTGGWRDKGSLSFYVAERDASRHRILQLLRQVDWPAKVGVLRRHIEAGHDVILLGEDLGRDPVTKLSVDPINGQAGDPSEDPAAGGRSPALPDPRIFEAIQAVGRGHWAPAWQTHPARIATIGRGRVIVDQTSFDQAGSANTQFDDAWARWRDRLRGLGALQ